MTNTGNSHHDTASELFARIAGLLTATCTDTSKSMHEILVLTCTEGLRDTKNGYGNLSAQVDALCRIFRFDDKERRALHTMRRHSNHTRETTPEELRYDCRALALLVSAVFGTDIPHRLATLIPHTPQPEQEHTAISLDYVRCTVEQVHDDHFTVSADQENAPHRSAVAFDNPDSHLDGQYLRQIIRTGTQLNLLDCTQQEGRLVPRLIVVEPDFLIDISTLASCFEDYGHHPLSYLLNLFRPRPNNRHILLGNLAGQVLDDIINQPQSTLADSLKKNFRDRALEYATCTDFNPDAFKADAATQARNMRSITQSLFTYADSRKAILEPSFVCERLGLQGRVDLMTTDRRLLVEQKAGRNWFVEAHRPNRHGSLYMEKHYMQVLLYFGIMKYNFGVRDTSVDVRLLYSRYADGLLAVKPFTSLLQEAIKLRNRIVAQQTDIAQRGLEPYLEQLTPDTLNEEHLDTPFFRKYQLPELQALTAAIHGMQPLEKAYFCRMATFLIKEGTIARMGAQEGMGNCMADLWNMPLSEKRETGNIFTGLTVTGKKASLPGGGYDDITLSIPQQAEDFLPNFRRGDMVFLYAYTDGTEPDARRSTLFKATIAHIGTGQVTVRLTNPQRNAGLFPTPRDAASGQRQTGRMLFAIEHSPGDKAAQASLSALFAMVTGNSRRKALILGQTAPQRDTSLSLSRSYHPHYDDILLRARQARDFFLLQGPPGTGKTSMALRFLVEEELTQPGASVLLTAFTNRAVDEICGMLCGAGIPFLRIGSEHSCDPRFHDHLIGHAIDETPRLDHLKAKLLQTPVMVATTSTLTARPSIFALRHFSLTIVDEAGQIPEATTLGALLQDGEEGGKFILVGDHKQLPAVVQQPAAESEVTDTLLRAIGLNDCRESLFERLLRNERQAGRTHFTGVLHRQGRMHTDIADFPLRFFYAREQLQAVPLPHQTEPLPVYPGTPTDDEDRRLCNHRILFCPSPRSDRPDFSDKANPEEAAIVARLLSRIHRLTGDSFNPATSVGVIVPYRNQIAMIRKAIDRLGEPLLHDVCIDTVERFQGSQRDTIIYSFTVQHVYQLDFLTATTLTEDGMEIDRKLNVALTRARKQLILTGNKETLRHNPTFSKLIDWASTYNL